MQTNVTVAFLDTRPSGFPEFQHYFRLAPKVPLFPYTTDLFVDRLVPIPDMSLTTLAEAMATHLKEGDNALIYTHAEPNNFVFPVDPAQPGNEFDVKEAAKLSYHLDLITANRVDSPVIDPFLHQPYGKFVSMNLTKHEKQFGGYSPASYMKIADDTTAQLLRGDLITIRNKKIGHLAVRACRVGQNKDFMRMLGLLFGAKTVSAPKLRTAAIKGNVRAVNIVPLERVPNYIFNTRSRVNGSGGYQKYEFPSTLPLPNGTKLPFVFSFDTTKRGKTTFDMHDVRASCEDAVMEFLWNVAGYTSLLGVDIAPHKVIALHALQGPHGLIFPKERAYLDNMEFVWVKR